MARNNKRARRRRRLEREALSQRAEIGPRARAFAAKHSKCDIAQVPTLAASQEHCWTRGENRAPEHHSSETRRVVDPDRIRNVWNARRRYESASLREMDTDVAIVWDTDARRRASATRKADGRPSFKSPERRVAGTPYTRLEVPKPSRVIVKFKDPGPTDNPEPFLGW